MFTTLVARTVVAYRLVGACRQPGCHGGLISAGLHDLRRDDLAVLNGVGAGEVLNLAGT
jgi:hypothetical protein